MKKQAADTWSDCTFAGARKTMLERNLRLSVRERLAMTQSLNDSADAIRAAAIRGAQDGIDNDVETSR